MSQAKGDDELDVLLTDAVGGLDGALARAGDPDAGLREVLAAASVRTIEKPSSVSVTGYIPDVLGTSPGRRQLRSVLLLSLTMISLISLVIWITAGGPSSPATGKTEAYMVDIDKSVDRGLIRPATVSGIGHPKSYYLRCARGQGNDFSARLDFSWSGLDNLQEFVGVLAVGSVGPIKLTYWVEVGGATVAQGELSSESSQPSVSLSIPLKGTHAVTVAGHFTGPSCDSAGMTLIDPGLRRAH